MGVMMILSAQLDDLDGVTAEATSDGIKVTGDLDAARDFLEDGWYTIEEQGMTPDGDTLAFVVSDTEDEDD